MCCGISKLTTLLFPYFYFPVFLSCIYHTQAPAASVLQLSDIDQGHDYRRTLEEVMAFRKFI